MSAYEWINGAPQRHLPAGLGHSRPVDRLARWSHLKPLPRHFPGDGVNICQETCNLAADLGYDLLPTDDASIYLPIMKMIMMELLSRRGA